MVNISKRMSVFQPKLLELRHGRGASVLPSAPAPQLTQVFLRYPRRHNLKPDVRTDGAHQFDSRYLPRLKYYNPTLKIDVKTDGSTHSTMKLVLQFESTDPEALRRIAKKSNKSRQPFQSTQQAQPVQQTQEELEAEAKLQSPNWRDAPAPKEAEQEAPEQTPRHPKLTADDDEVVLKVQPASELGLRSNVPVYTRSVTLPINRKPHWEIWQWFKKRTGAEAVPWTEADRQLQQRIDNESQQRAVDREKGAVVAAQVRREREALDKAKKAADEAATRQ